MDYHCSDKDELLESFLERRKSIVTHLRRKPAQATRRI